MDTRSVGTHLIVVSLCPNHKMFSLQMSQYKCIENKRCAQSIIFTPRQKDLISMTWHDMACIFNARSVESLQKCGSYVVLNLQFLSHVTLKKCLKHMVFLFNNCLPNDKKVLSQWHGLTFLITDQSNYSITKTNFFWPVTPKKSQ